MKNVEKVRVFLASPGDVHNERNEVIKIVDQINFLISDKFRILFEVINWEKMTPGMGRAQQVVNKKARIDRDVDLFIGVLWARFGSYPGKNKYNAESGTQEEFEQAYECFNNTGIPHIKFFWCQRNIGVRSSPDQLSKVQNFMDEFGPNGNHPGLIKEYKTIKEFRSDISSVLLEYAFDHSKKGILTTFQIDDDTPVRRWGEKVTAIREASQYIKLMAHSGYSFFAEQESKYRQQIEEILKKEIEVRIVINIPWSYSGLFCAIADNVTPSTEILNIICNGGEVTDNLINSIQSTIIHSRWYETKVKKTISGYKDLCAIYNDRIQMRFYKYEIPASVLITDKVAFIEPYIMANRSARHIQGLNTFKVRVPKGNDAWKNYHDYFDLIWNLSLPYSDGLEVVSKERIESFLKP